MELTLAPYVLMKNAGDSYMKFWIPGLKAILLVFGFFILMPQPSHAIPAFARRYRLRCFACHTIPPVLNKEGYMFKRLGFHLPPALQKGEASPLISDLVKQEPTWALTNNVAFAVADFDFAAQRNTQEGTTPNSASSFQLGTWNAYLGGWVPDTNFFYYSQINLVSGGSTNPNVAVGYFGYVGGTARSSWFVQGGQMHVMGANGTTAGNTESFLPNAPLMWEYSDPDNFTLDQHMVGLRAGYTWALPGYKQIFGASLSVSNGDHADGSTITGPDAKNSKDLYVDLDWWYAPESGVTFLSYYGKKNQIQNSGAPNQFTFYPTIHRNGIFANYMAFHDRLNVLGGFMDDHDGYEISQSGPSSSFISRDYYGELDYFLVRGTAAIARYDRLNQRIIGGIGGVSQEQPSFGLERTFTPSGNIIGRLSYSNLHGRDPIAGINSSGRTIMSDVEFNF
jgi:hypothetical protein